MMSLIPKHLITYRGYHCSRENRLKAIKYGFHLSSTRYENYSREETVLSKRVIMSQGRKKAAGIDFNYHFERHQDRLAQDIGRISGMRSLKLNFYVDFDFDFYKSASSLDSQYAVYSNGEEDSGDYENELHGAIQSSTANNSLIIQKNKRMLKKVFKQAKRVTYFSITFPKIDSNHDRALHYLPILNLLEQCHIKVKIRAPTDILALRDLLSQAKQRKHWPNRKSMVISLRHSYNQENCSSRFIRFCRVLQDIAEITKDLTWIKIQLKVKYLWRLNEPAVIALQGTLEKVQNQLIKLSFVARQIMRLNPLFETIKEMKNLEKFSVRFTEAYHTKGIHPLEKLTESLKKIQSLRRLKVHGRNILDKDQNKKLSTQGCIENLSDFPQITSLNFQGKNQSIDENLWSCFSSSISKLPQLQVLTIRIHSTMMPPDMNGFLDFFAGLKNFQNLRIFGFAMYHSVYGGPRINGNQIFPAVCEALQNQKKLRKLHFHYPWTPKMNSDIEELTKIFPNLKRLEDLTLNFTDLRFVEPVENDVLLKFTKAISSLKAIQSFSINLEMKEVNNLTYEAALVAFKHFQTRNTDSHLVMQSTQIDEEAEEKVHLLKGIYIKSIWED